MSHPAILQAYVTFRSYGTGSPVLSMYVVPIPGTEALRGIDDSVATTPDGAASLVDTCESYLRERLPTYLVPSTDVVMAELPRPPPGRSTTARCRTRLPASRGPTRTTTSTCCSGAWPRWSPTSSASARR
jgi:hypothetical protein